MGVELNQTQEFHIDLSHQEMDRILQELEALYGSTAGAGGEWLTLQAAGNWLVHELGYEDMDEFEDALHGTFEQFLRALPSVEVGADDKGRPCFKVLPDPPQEQWQPKRLELRIADRTDLWNVLLKAPSARAEIPEMEFEISEDSRRKTDSVYNHLAAAIFNLGTHVRSVPMSDDTKNKIVDCIMALNELLDVPRPWTLVVHDPSGLSQFSDMTNVTVTHPGDGSGDGGGEGQQQQQQPEQQQSEQQRQQAGGEQQAAAADASG